MLLSDLKQWRRIKLINPLWNIWRIFVAESFFDGGNFVQSIDFTIMKKLGSSYKFLFRWTLEQMDSNQRFISLIKMNGELKFHTCKRVVSCSSNSKRRNFDICDLEFIENWLLTYRKVAGPTCEPRYSRRRLCWA